MVDTDHICDILSSFTTRWCHSISSVRLSVCDV